VLWARRTTKTRSPEAKGEKSLQSTYPEREQARAYVLGSADEFEAIRVAV
jgi:hypothetical protein